MGGMLVLEWLSQFPDHIFSAIPIATTTSHSAQNIALNELARQAIMADPEWKSGNYNEFNTKPIKGLSVARMAAHITYLSKKGYMKNLVEIYKIKVKLNFLLMQTFRLKAI